MIRKRYVLPASTVTFSWVQPAHTATQTRGGECGAAINLVQPARCTQTTSHYQHGEGGGGSPAAAIAADQYMLWYAPGRWCAPCGQAGRQAGKRASRQAGKRAGRWWAGIDACTPASHHHRTTHLCLHSPCPHIASIRHTPTHPGWWHWPRAALRSCQGPPNTGSPPRCSWAAGSRHSCLCR